MSGIEDVLHGSEDECFLEVIVTPEAKKEDVGGIDIWRKRLDVKVKEKAVENRANLAVLRLLEDFFSISHGSATIVRGAKSKKKTVRLGVGRGEAEVLLIRHIGAGDEVRRH